jgi:ABC-type multidrug transport system ATPase subunit
MHNAFGKPAKRDPMNTIIELENVTFRYRRPRNEIFREFNLSIFKGQITCILGHNGAGKTTLLKLIYGILKPDSGQVSLNRSLVPAHKDIFFLSGQFGINQELTLKENIVFKCMLLGEDQGAALSHSTIHEFKMADSLDMPTNRLSSGNLTRANLVAGLIFDPVLLLLDEPTNSIDPASRELLMQVLRNQQEAGATTVMVTHDLDFAYNIGDRLIVIEEGRIVLDDIDHRNVPYKIILNRYVNYTEQSMQRHV